MPNETFAQSVHTLSSVFKTITYPIYFRVQRSNIRCNRNHLFTILIQSRLQMRDMVREQERNVIAEMQHVLNLRDNEFAYAPNHTSGHSHNSECGTDGLDFGPSGLH